MFSLKMFFHVCYKQSNDRNLRKAYLMQTIIMIFFQFYFFEFYIDLIVA